MISPFERCLIYEYNSEYMQLKSFCQQSTEKFRSGQFLKCHANLSNTCFVKIYILSCSVILQQLIIHFKLNGRYQFCDTRWDMKLCFNSLIHFYCLFGALRKPALKSCISFIWCQKLAMMYRSCTGHCCFCNFLMANLIHVWQQCFHPIEFWTKIRGKTGGRIWIWDTSRPEIILLKHVAGFPRQIQVIFLYLILVVSIVFPRHRSRI